MLIGYWLFALGMMVGTLIPSPGTMFVCKPMLMLLLIFYLFWSMQPYWLDEDSLMVFALIGAWWGDIALMFGEKFIMFILGIVGFFIMQMLFAKVYRATGDQAVEPILRRKWYIGLPAVIFGLVAFGFLYEPLATWQLRLAVFTYTAAIIYMVLAAVNRFERVNKQSFMFVLGGAVLFMLSDFLIAFNKFLTPFPYADALIMALYMPAQYLIVEGYIRQGKPEGTVP